MAESAVTLLLENVNRLLTHHANLVGHAKNELQQLAAYLLSLKGMLSQGEGRKTVSEDLGKEIQKAIYDVEDMIDCAVSAASVGKSTTILRRLHLTTSSSVGPDVKEFMEKTLVPLTNKVKDLPNDLSTADGANASREEEAKWKDTRSKNPREGNVVGLDDELETLMGFIDEESHGLDVISITGMPGIGKTTMAWRIFNEPRIRFEFPVVVWVDVSQVLNIRDVCLTILGKLTEQDLSTKEDDKLIEMVSVYLENGKFLIVFDDVWTIETWEVIKGVLPKKNALGKVLITTRNKDVCRHENPNRIHKLRCLNLEESWELLRLEVFGDTNDYPQELEEVGKVIAERCKGRPLTIIVIGGILIDSIATTGAEMTALKREWEEVSNSVSTHVYAKDRGTDYIISRSYASLPSDLKDCFLYLGVFPEDMEIPVWQLTLLWIAEGFVREEPKKALEETAKEYVKELIDRNLLMVEKVDVCGEVRTCRVHDMIREFCKKEACNNDADCLKLFRDVGSSGDQPPISDLDQCRRLCIHSSVGNFLSGKPKVARARSFLSFSRKSTVLDLKEILYITDAFFLVRVLDANTIRFSKVPAKVTQLVHLRYITLSGDDLKVLPVTMSNLWNLQTIVVDTSSRTLEIKADVWKLLYLRHLKTKASIILEKGKGAGGECLQTLMNLSPKSLNDDLCDKVKNLKELGIRGALSPSISFNKLTKLEKLKLVHDVSPMVASEKRMPRLPQPNRYPAKLRILVLSNCYLEWKQLSTLGSIESLKVLKLKHNACMGSSWGVADDDFGDLETLSIEDTDLRHWSASTGSFAKLKTLVLKNCENLVQIPVDLESLEMLSMKRVTKYAITYAKKIEQKKGEKSGFKLVVAPGDMIGF